MEIEKQYKAALKLRDDGDLAGAVIAFTQLINAHTDTRFHSAFGLCLQQLRHWEQSIAQFIVALELKPHYCESDTRLMLAESYQGAGRIEKAIEQWRLVSLMQPEYPSYDATINEAKLRLQQFA